jgi:NAD(P)-dependent dehydrogenase (short-subunit alcohol dehydrogenase family)
MKLEQLFDLSGRVALITGGSRGLGFTMAAALGEMGASIAITARTEDELESAREELRENGCEKVFAATSDLSRPETIETMVDAVVGALGPIDILVNNAGTSWGAPAVDYPLEGWRKVIDVNLTGTWLVTQKVARESMIPGGGGRIINISSGAGLKGSSRGFNAVAYNTSKGGLISFTRALAGEWGPHNINVNAICPGFFPSKMTKVVLDRLGEEVTQATPLRRLGSDDDLKGIAVLLASDAGRHITGQAIAVDGGITAV